MTLRKGDTSGLFEYKTSELAERDVIIKSPTFFEFIFDNLIIKHELVDIFSMDSKSLDFKLKNQESLTFFLKREISEYLRKYDKIQNQRNKSLSLRQYSQRYHYSWYDIDYIINYFDEDSRDQLVTIFEQAMFCFEHSKYLASAACIGVGIEELCLLILENLGFSDDIRNKNTTIVELGGILRRKGVINRRISSILVASSIIRNSISHTSTGYVSATQVYILISTFKQLFDSFLDYTSKLES